MCERNHDEPRLENVDCRIREDRSNMRNGAGDAGGARGGNASVGDASGGTGGRGLSKGTFSFNRWIAVALGPPRWDSARGCGCRSK